jgi:hypothetical protein
MSNQPLHLIIREVEAGHSFIEAARAHQGGDLSVGVRSHKAKQGRRAVASVAISAMTDCATVPEGPDGRGRLLSVNGTDREKNRAAKSLEHSCSSSSRSATHDGFRALNGGYSVRKSGQTGPKSPLFQMPLARIQKLSLQFAPGDRICRPGYFPS